MMFPMKTSQLDVHVPKNAASQKNLMDFPIDVVNPTDFPLDFLNPTDFPTVFPPVFPQKSQGFPTDFGRLHEMRQRHRRLQAAVDQPSRRAQAVAPQATQVAGSLEGRSMARSMAQNPRKTIGKLENPGKTHRKTIGKWWFSMGFHGI